MRFLLTPTNVIQASRTVTVVVGEPACAMNFSLNGYWRDTNPRLAQQPGLLSFSQVESCGTSTAVSVPCVFSSLARADYSEDKARSQEGLLDVISHAGFGVLWRDNNCGCKGACDRVAYEDLSQPKAGDPLCNNEECYDERLLQGLPDIIRTARRDLVIVLHQKGSHGPAYWKRYPPAFQHFGPVCTSHELEKCSSEATVAAHDNTIRYTDYVLSKTIDVLRAAAAEDGVDTAMLYFSDHGESLGESNVYLHGAPYIMAPEAQRHVPMVFWMGDSYRDRFALGQRCLEARRHASGRVALGLARHGNECLQVVGVDIGCAGAQVDVLLDAGGAQAQRAQLQLRRIVGDQPFRQRRHAAPAGHHLQHDVGGFDGLVPARRHLGR
jgi:lipid A ethanolaminephosphotransferase